MPPRASILLRCVSGLLATCCLVALVPAALASHEAHDFSLNGFGTLGAARTTSDHVEFVRDITQPRGARTQWDGRVDSVLGLQANWRMAPAFEAVIQAVTRYRPDRSFTPELAWAYVKYDPGAQVSLRAGRLGTEFFMLADSRLVGYSYLTVRPVGDYFWYLPFSSIDGGDLLLTFPLGENILRAKAFYGISDGSIPRADEQWKIDGSPMAGAYVEYLLPSWVVRLSYANIKFKRSLPIAGEFSKLPASAFAPGDAAASLDYLETAGTRSHYYSLGVVFDNGPWQFQFMLNHVDQGSKAFESSTAGYALAGYRIASVTPFLGYSWVDSDRRSDPVSQAAAAVSANARSNQSTTMLGARWDVARNIALKAQWDAIRGDASSIFPYRREDAGWRGKLDVFSLTMDFVF